jgi:hypothetical protein
MQNFLIFAGMARPRITTGRRQGAGHPRHLAEEPRCGQAIEGIFCGGWDFEAALRGEA